jgi:nitroreductase
MPEDLSRVPLPGDTVCLLEGLTSTRAIRPYTDEDIPHADLRAILFGATRAPSGSNRQPTRYVILRQGDPRLKWPAVCSGNQGAGSRRHHCRRHHCRRHPRWHSVTRT